MSATYTTQQGDMLDAIVWRIFGATAGYVEAVLDANKGLASLADPLPAGTVIIIPDIETDSSDAEGTISLWD